MADLVLPLQQKTQQSPWQVLPSQSNTWGLPIPTGHKGAWMPLQLRWTSSVFATLVSAPVIATLVSAPVKLIDIFKYLQRWCLLQ